TYSCRAAASASTARCMGSASTRPIGAGPWVASSWLIWFVLRSSRRSERDVAVLLRRKRRSLGAQRAQGAHDLYAGLGRPDHRVDVPALGGVPRVDDGVLVLGGQPRPLRLDVAARLRAGLQGAALQDVHGAARAHDGDLRGGPGQVDVGAELLGAHDDVRAAVRLARDDRD